MLSKDCRLLYVVGQLRGGGLERQLCYLLSNLDRERYKPQVLVWNYSEDDVYVSLLRALGVPIIGLTAQCTKMQKLKAARRVVKNLNPEVIHSYSFYTNFGAWWAATGMSYVVVGSVRSDFVRARMESGLLLGRLCAYWPRRQIFNSATAASDARQRDYLLSPQEVFVIRNSVDLGAFNRTPLPNGGLVTVIGIGSLVQVKRWDRLLIVAAQLKREGLDFRVRLVGDGPLRNSLERQAVDLGIGHCIEFAGQRSDISSLLSAATVLVHPSESEGCPNVVMEAMACGRPVVSTDVGDARYLVEDGKTGFVVQNGDDKALARRIATVITNRELCEEMGAAGRIKAEREFGVARMVEETLSVYRAGGWQE